MRLSTTLLTLLLLLASLFAACDLDDVPIDPDPGGGGDGTPGEVVILPLDLQIPCAEQHALDAEAHFGVLNGYQPTGEYWARHGFPPLARLASIREAMGLDGLATFDIALAHFDANGFFNALELGELSPQLNKRLQIAMQVLPGAPIEEVLVYVIRSLVDELDAWAEGLPPAYVDNPALTGVLAEVYEVAFWPLGKALAPQVEKVCVDPESTVLAGGATIPGSLDCTEAGNASDPECGGVIAEGPPDDSDTTTNNVDWEKITSILWKTSYNPSCVMQSVGLCLHKLGKLAGEKVTCKMWNDFGKAIGGNKVRDADGDPIAGADGKPVSGGATRGNIDSYMKDTHKLCATTATDTAKQTACAQADAARARGCDVIMYWRTHAEMVTGIGKPNAQGACQVSTSSWGKAATVDYDDGKANNHSEANQFGAGSSVRQANSPVSLVMYCPCK